MTPVRKMSCAYVLCRKSAINPRTSASVNSVSSKPVVSINLTVLPWTEVHVLQARRSSVAVPRRQVQSQVYTGVDELVRQQSEGQWGSISSQGAQSSGGHGRDQDVRQVRVIHKGKKRPWGGLGWHSLR